MTNRSEKFLTIYKVLGRKQIAVRLQSPMRTVDAAVNAKRFPAAWFAVIAEMCAELEIICPIEVFSFHQAEHIGARCTVRFEVSKGGAIAA